MTKEELQLRTKEFAISILGIVDELPNNAKGWVVSKQIIRSATSVAANYRAVCRAKSDKDFISKMGTVIEEADETLFWLELIRESGTLDDSEFLKELEREANELVSIFVASNLTIKRRLNR